MIDDAFGAFLRDYNTKIEDTAFLEKYLIEMGIKGKTVLRLDIYEVD